MAAAVPLEILCLRVQCVKPVAPDAHQNTGESGRQAGAQLAVLAAAICHVFAGVYDRCLTGDEFYPVCTAPLG